MADETECYENAENELFNGDMSIEGTTNNKLKYKELNKCQCLPQCESLKYEIELVKTNYKTHLTDYMTIASLKVFFKDNEFVPLKRFQLYGTVDFLANCGSFQFFVVHLSGNFLNNAIFRSRWLAWTVCGRLGAINRRDILLLRPEVKDSRHDIAGRCRTNFST